MGNNIKAEGFKGMNDALVNAERSMSIPSIILNANVGLDGNLEKRDGCKKIVDLPGAHSMWTDSNEHIFCMAGGSLYRVVDGTDGKEALVIIDTGQVDNPTSYLELSGVIYISNKLWAGALDPVANTCESWGTAVPEAPVLVPEAGGNLPAGVYSVCVTIPGAAGRTSGNSPMSQLTITEDGGKATISNLPDDGVVWMTDPNGGQVYKNVPATTGVISNLSETSEPLPTIWGSPPLPMSNITYAHGRVWGGRNDKVYFSEPYQPELFILSESFFDLKSEIGMIAKSNAGIFVGTKEETVFFSGTNPLEMSQRHVGGGVVPGTLCYANKLGDLGSNVPIWIGKDGVIAGSMDGQTINLLKEKVKIDPEQAQGAAIYREQDGQTRMMFAYQQKESARDVAMGDDATCEVIRKGTVI